MSLLHARAPWGSRGPSHTDRAGPGPTFPSPPQPAQDPASPGRPSPPSHSFHDTGTPQTAHLLGRAGPQTPPASASGPGQPRGRAPESSGGTARAQNILEMKVDAGPHSSRQDTDPKTGLPLPLRFLRNKPPGERGPSGAQLRRKQRRVPAHCDPPPAGGQRNLLWVIKQPRAPASLRPQQSQQRSEGTRQGSRGAGASAGAAPGDTKVKNSQQGPWKSPTGSRGLAPRGGGGCGPSRAPAGHPTATHLPGAGPGQARGPLR